MDDAPNSCRIGPGERISLSDPRLRDCELLPGTRITMQYDPPLPRPERTMRKVKHREPAADTADDQPDDPVVVVESPPAALLAPAPTAAVVGVPATGTDDLLQLLPVHGEVGGLSLVLAVIAVLGGGAGWKFYSQRSRERHELAMRELELRAAGGQGQLPECKADGAAWRAEVARLDGRLVEIAARQDGLVLPSVPPDLEDRLARLEAAGKPAPARRGKATGGK